MASITIDQPEAFSSSKIAEVSKEEPALLSARQLAASKKDPMQDSENVNKLLSTHADRVNNLLEACADLTSTITRADGKPGDVGLLYDELFALRYCLSFPEEKDPEAALANMRKGIIWRQNNIEFLEKSTKFSLSKGNWDQLPTIAIESTMYQVAHAFHEGTKYGSFCVVIRAGLGNTSSMYDNTKPEDHRQLHMMFREAAYRYCDSVTRKTRRLVKQTLLMDLTGAKLTAMMDTRGHEIHKPVSEMSFYLYPQLQGPFIMVNCPSWITVLWTAIKQVMPKKSVEKMKIGNGNAADEKFVQENFFVDELPAFLGGGKKGPLPAELDGSLLGKIAFPLDDGDKATGRSSLGYPMDAIKLGAVKKCIIKSTRVVDTGLNIPAGTNGTRFIVLPTKAKMRSGARFGCFLTLESKDLKVSVYLTTDLEAATPKVQDGSAAQPTVSAMLQDSTTVARSEGNVLLSVPLDIARDKIAPGTEVKVVVLFDNSYSYMFSKNVDYEMGLFDSFGRRFAQ